MIIIEDFNASLVLQAVHKERATALYGVPTMFIAELNSPELDSVRPLQPSHGYHGG